MTTNNDDTNVANNVAQSKVQDLTEQWKKGELEQGWYYTKYNPKVGEPFVEIELKSYLLDLAKVRDADTVEVLAPVPSYEEWKELKDEVEIYHNNFKLMKAELERELENQQLKELLKECKETIYNLIDDEPCEYDHHGYCQAHGWMSNDMCPNERGKNLITKIDNAIGEKK